MPARAPGDEWFVGGCVIPPGPRPEFGCRDCGRVWSHVPLRIRAGEVVETEQGPTVATRSDLTWVRRARLVLVEWDEHDRDIDAVELMERVELPCELDDLARLLDLLTEDCERRGEPSLSRRVAGVPGEYRGWEDGTVLMPSQDEVQRILQEDLESRQYVDDPDHPHRSAR